MTPNPHKTILIVDDDRTFRNNLVVILRRRGHQAMSAATGAEALAIAARHDLLAAVVDLRLGEESGLDVARSLRGLNQDLRILILTGYGSIATAVSAMRLGAIDYLAKPVDVTQILNSLFGAERGLEKRESSDPKTTPEVPSLARVEWEHLQRVLRDTGGNISEAARRLGLERRTVQRKLKKHPPQQ